MGTWLAAIVAVLTVTGCKYGADSFSCTGNASCGTGGTCQPNNLCSFPDNTCPSGQRYGDIAGTSSGDCVGELPIDASIDMPLPPDTRLCFGNAFPICLMALPTTQLTLSSTTPIDTDTASCAATTSGATGYCVLTGTTIAVEGVGNLRATGNKPLVLLAIDSITAIAGIDVGSHRGVNPETGAGADPAACTAMAGTNPNNGGGGAGGSFAGLGGAGAASANGGSTGGMPGPVASITTLRGGCPGHDGEGSSRGSGGHGGGAVLLIAGNSITIGGEINAGGEGGRAGQQNTSGGGGGGAGGMIVLDAQTVTNTALLLANGGGGGEGSGEATAGGNGGDPITIAAALGGTGLANGGDGGVGSATAAAGPGGTGNVGIVVNPGSLRGGGGAGGGGAGLIKAPAGASLGAMVSPTATQ
jgi:hypothetical protein